MMILILSGPIRSYKTSTLLRWVEDRVDCGGVLSPDVDGLRCLYNIREKNYIPWQKEKVESSSDRAIGQFVYDTESYQKARVWLDDHLDEDAVRFLILDEVGPLELSGNGWDGWLKSCLEKTGDKTLILVVRETLVDEVVARYGLEGYSVVGKEYFASL